MENKYDTFGVDNVVRFHGKFEHPWFYDTKEHRLMEEYSPEFVHLKTLKSGIIFQFRLGTYAHFRHCLLLTSTAEDTYYMNASNPDIDANLMTILNKGRPAPSKTAYNGIVTFGKYFTQQWEHLHRTMSAEDVSFAPSSLKLIVDYLRRYQNAKKPTA